MKEFKPRSPTTAEIVAITQANIEAGFGDYTPEHIAVWDHYMSDGPGYTGWVAVGIGGEPHFSDTYTKEDGIVVKEESE